MAYQKVLYWDQSFAFSILMLFVIFMFEERLFNDTVFLFPSTTRDNVREKLISDYKEVKNYLTTFKQSFDIQKRII